MWTLHGEYRLPSPSSQLTHSRAAHQAFCCMTSTNSCHGCYQHSLRLGTSDSHNLCSWRHPHLIVEDTEAARKRGILLKVLPLVRGIQVGLKSVFSLTLGSAPVQPTLLSAAKVHLQTNPREAHIALQRDMPLLFFCDWG